MYKIVSLLILFFCSLTVQAQWQLAEMSKIDRKVGKYQKCKCLSKTQEIDNVKVSYYFTPKKKTMIKIVERRVVNGATVFRQFFFDKKTGGLISVNLGSTIFYYQRTGYFSVLSNDHFTDNEAKERGNKLLNLARKYVKELK